MSRYAALRDGARPTWCAGSGRVLAGCRRIAQGRYECPVCGREVAAVAGNLARHHDRRLRK